MVKPSSDTLLSTWTYPVQLIVVESKDNSLYSNFKELTGEHLLPPISIDQCSSTLHINDQVKQLVIQILTLSVDERNDLLDRFSSLNHIESIYLLGKPMETKEERLKFFHQYPKVCIFCEDEGKLALRWSLDTIEECRTSGDQYIKQKNKDAARDFYQRGFDLFDKINKFFHK